MFLSINNLRLWSNILQVGVPITQYGFFNGTVATGPGYRFDVDPEMDCWLCSNGALMPISECKLVVCEHPMPFGTRWTLMENGSVQFYIPAGKLSSEYIIRIHQADVAGYEGDVFDMTS